LDRPATEPAETAAHSASVEDRLRHAPDRVAGEAGCEQHEQHARPAALDQDDEGAARVRQPPAGTERKLEREYADDEEARALGGEPDASQPADPRAARSTMR